MKTRKVGKIVSLLVAIVLVATIMIPAASVLADNGSNAVTSGVDWTGEDVKVIGGDNAYGDLDAYLASLTPNSDKVYNIRLDADVNLPTFGVYTDEDGNTSSDVSKGKYYSYATYGVFKDAFKKQQQEGSWSKPFSSGDQKKFKFGIDEILGRSGKTTYEADYDGFLNQTPKISTNPYQDVFNVAERGDTTTRAFLNYDLQGKEKFSPAEKERFERLDTAQKKLMTGARGNQGLGASAGNDTATYTEYDEAMLCVKEGVTVCLNLNGHKVSGLNSLGSPYTGSPNYQTSIFVVRGKLTVVDEHTTNAGKAVGMITGGTGSIYGKPQYRPNGDSNYDLVDSGMYQGVAYYGVGLGTNAPNVWGDAYIIRLGEKAPDGQTWPKGVLGHSSESWTHSVGNYRIYTNYYSRFYANVKETHGGGVYVAPGASFTLLSGKISGNSAWRLNDTKNTFIFDTGASAAACGGGVYVDEGATFTMKGGEISNNAVRVYNKKGDNSDATAYGGGVYLAKKAVMNMTGGKIVENASYAETYSPNGDHSKSARSYGAGIYVHAEATCNIIGEDAESGATTLEMVKNFPSVSNNSCGALGRKTSTTVQDITVEGGGIYNSGTLNLRNALVSANDFAEGDIDVPNASEKCTLNNAIHVKRDEYLPEDQRTITYSDGKTATLPGTGTGLALYVLDYWEDGRPKTYITRLDDRFNENLELATEQVAHETSGIYGTMHGNEESAIFSNGAGICLNEKATIVIGERVWVIDNYDLVTTGHKAFASVRDYTRTWQQTKTITDDRVVSTDPKTGKGADYTDPAGGYVYNEYVAPGSGSQNGGKYTPHRMDGYAFSDTTDDIYLPDGKVIYKGGSLYETKIGVNYWDMVNADGKVTEKKEAERGKGQAGSRAGNRVLLVDGNVLGNLDRKIWTGDNMTPVQSDIQFFYLNDNNKNWERYKDYVKDPNDLWYDYNKKEYGYKLPDYIIQYPSWDVGKTTPCELCDPKLTTSYDNRSRATCIDVSSVTDEMKQTSPYEGYINYDYSYPSKRWVYFTKASSNAGFEDTTYDQPTYRISDPYKDPQHDKTMTEFTNSIVNFPQRAYPVTAQMKKDLPSSYLKAKYMDYKVVYDDNQFGTSTEPVIRLGTYSDPASNDTIRKMFVTVNFDEADIHFYGQSKNSSIVYNSGSAATNEQTYTFTTKNTAFANVDASALFYGANRVKGTINIAKIVPDYESYGKGDILNALRAAASADAESSLSYDDEDKKNESIDLYFKGWKYYTSYGDGPKVETLSNSVEERTIKGTSLSYRGYFPVNLKNIFNPNINSQPCPSLTAIWYTKEELAAARQNLSACKAQLILGTDGRIYIRVISVLGAYGKDRNNLQPIQASDANSSLSSLYYNAPTFVASKLNATPTLEGGYKATVNKGNIAAGENFSARVVKKIICNDDEKNTFTIDIYDYISGKENKENDVWVKFINSNPEYKKANNSKSNTYVSFMWTNIDTGLTLADISNGSGYSDAAQEVWFVTPCIELTTDQAGYEHDSYYYGASRGFSIASLDTQDLNKLLKQAKAMN